MLEYVEDDHLMEGSPYNSDCACACACARACVRLPDGASRCVYHVVTGASDAILDGFTITGGRAEGELWEERSGGGLFADGVRDLRIANCTFRRNSAIQGGAIYTRLCGDVTISRCIFEQNQATWGGGIFTDNGRDRLITSSLFLANYADYGAALCNFTFNAPGTPELVNTTIVGNVAGIAGGAAMNSRSTPVITNSILWFNEPDTIWDVESGTGVTMTYTDVEGGYAGTGNIDVAPLLENVPIFWDRATGGVDTSHLVVADPSMYAIGETIELNDDGVARAITGIDAQSGTLTFSPPRGNPTWAGMLVEDWGASPGSLEEDYHLRQWSPCIDQGNSAVAPEHDLDGNPRCGPADMGAYEYQSHPCQ